MTRDFLEDRLMSALHGEVLGALEEEQVGDRVRDSVRVSSMRSR